MVPPKLELLVGRPCGGGAGEVGLNGVVDLEINRAVRLDGKGVASSLCHCVAHGSEVDEGGDAAE